VQPTERLGINVALKDKQVIYANQNRTLKENRRLLMEAYKPSTRAPKQSKVPSPMDSYPPQDTLLIPLFPANVLVGSQPASSSDDVLQQSATLNSSLTPAVVVPPITTVVDDIHQQNAVVAISMSAAPFAAYSGAIGNGGDDDDDSSTHSKTSDYGANDHESKSSLGNTDYDDSNAPQVDNDAILSDFDGHHSDLFENLFQSLPVGANKYRLPGRTFNGFHGPLLFSSHAHPLAVPALLPHADDGVFLSQECQDATFEQIAHLLYLNWNILHEVDALPEFKKWLESLSKENHLLLVHLHAAYWVTIPATTLSFGETKANFWNAVNSAGRFLNGVFVITHEIPPVSVTVESFMVRTVGQWVQLGCYARRRTQFCNFRCYGSSSVQCFDRCIDRNGQLLL